uniref:HIT domain-containing protein n=1 Tax=Hucho hucho TaxID=62062 RepID=A0A4W5PC06_9TELE
MFQKQQISFLGRCSSSSCAVCRFSAQSRLCICMLCDSELVCFRDIDPAAPHHYLVVPKKHIESCFSLFKEHIKLVERMAEMGRAVLQENGITNPNDIRMGFHRPPYISVPHLHLHVLAPTSEITDYMAHKFIPGTMRFATVSANLTHSEQIQ